MSDLMKIGGLLCIAAASESESRKQTNIMLSSDILKNNGSEIDYDHLKMLSNCEDSISKHSLKRPILPSVPSPSSSSNSGELSPDQSSTTTTSIINSSSNPLGSIISVTSYDRTNTSNTGNSKVSTALNGSTGSSPSSIAPQLSISSSSASPSNSSSSSISNNSPSNSFYHPDLSTNSLPPTINQIKSFSLKDKEEDLNFSQLAKSFINNSFINNNNNSSNNSNSNSNNNNNKSNEMILNSIRQGNLVVSPTSSPPHLSSNSINNNNNSSSNNIDKNKNSNIYSFTQGEEGSSGELDSLPPSSDDDAQQALNLKIDTKFSENIQHPVSSRKLWSQEECCQLLELVLKLDPQSYKSKESENRWRTIASELGRTVTSTRKKYMRLMNRWSSSTPTPNQNSSTSSSYNVPDISNSNSVERKRKEIEQQHIHQIQQQQQQQIYHPLSQQQQYQNYHSAISKVELLPQTYSQQQQQQQQHYIQNHSTVPQQYHHQMQQYRYNNNDSPTFNDGYQHNYILKQQQQQPAPRYPMLSPQSQIPPLPQSVYQNSPPQRSTPSNYITFQQVPYSHSASAVIPQPTVPQNHHFYSQQQQQQQQQQSQIKRHKTSSSSSSTTTHQIPQQMLNLQQSLNSQYSENGGNASPSQSPNLNSSPSQSYGFRVISEQLTGDIPFQPKRRPKSKSIGKSD